MPDGFQRVAKALAIVFGMTGLLAATDAVAGPVSSPAAATIARQVQPATFWGRPYPYGYAWRPAGRWACYAWRRIETPEGWRYARVPVCGNAVSELY
jgi:hypothetical protein